MNTNRTFTTILLATAAMAIPAAAPAQQFSLFGRNVQVHGFASQGYALSDENNYLTMNTSKGSFAFTDGGLNLSTSITDKFRVGAQGYIREVGQLGGGRFSVDWAIGDYRFKDWFGVRAGKVKTVLGLFNDTQDAEFLHTWALMPQSLYPADLRSSLIAHTGGDVYGHIDLRRAGSLAYTAYVGRRSDDRRSGYYFNTQDTRVPVNAYSGTVLGGDLRWNTPVTGLIFGGSFLDEKDRITGTLLDYGNSPYLFTSKPQHVSAGYIDYTRGKLRVNAEARRYTEVEDANILGQHLSLNYSYSGWYASAAYRINQKFEIGTYHSRLYVDVAGGPDPAANHIYDQTVTARVDVRRWWDVKVEGHFIDGYGDTYSAHGFYLRSNSQGLKPKTDLFIVRTGFYF